MAWLLVQDYALGTKSDAPAFLPELERIVYMTELEKMKQNASMKEKLTALGLLIGNIERQFQIPLRIINIYTEATPHHLLRAVINKRYFEAVKK